MKAPFGKNRRITAVIVMTGLGLPMSPAAGQPTQPPRTPTEYEMVVERDVKVPMRDGIRLAVDIYFPARDGRALDGPLPAIAMKRASPRGREPDDAEGLYYASRGYVYVRAACRGSYGSEGAFYSYVHDGQDGYDLLEWIARQSWSDGKVATDGGSHSGWTQYATALYKPPSLVAQFIREAGSDYHENGAWRGGAFLLGRGGRGESTCCGNRHTDMLLHPDYDDYWRQIGFNVKEYFGVYPDVPIYFLGGWYDYFQNGTLESYIGLSRAGTTPKKLIVGPWIHLPQNVESHKHGDVDFGAEAALDFLALREPWFARWLKGKAPAPDEPPVRIFVMGTGDGHRTEDGSLFHGGYWRDEEEWPLQRAEPTPFYLHAGGRLAREVPAPSAPTAYTYDPERPVPTIVDWGAYDQRCRRDLPNCTDESPLAARPDVLVFRTEPIESDVEVTGPITVRLFASSDAVDTDFTAKLIDEYPPSADFPEGFSLILVDGVRRGRYRNSLRQAEPMEAGRVYEFEIELNPTSNVFKREHRIRVDISSSNFPRFDANPNTGEPIGFHTRTRPALNRVLHDPEHMSHIVLPLVATPEAAR